MEFLDILISFIQSVDWNTVYTFFFGSPDIIQAGSITSIIAIVAVAAGGWLVIRANGTVAKVKNRKELRKILKEERE